MTITQIDRISYITSKNKWNNDSQRKFTFLVLTRTVWYDTGGILRLSKIEESFRRDFLSYLPLCSTTSIGRSEKMFTGNFDDKILSKKIEISEMSSVQIVSSGLFKIIQINKNGWIHTASKLFLYIWIWYILNIYDD